MSTCLLTFKEIINFSFHSPLKSVGKCKTSHSIKRRNCRKNNNKNKPGINKSFHLFLSNFLKSFKIEKQYDNKKKKKKKTTKTTTITKKK